MKKLNTAIVGFGLSGSTFHAPIITNSNCFNLCYVNSSQLEKVQKFYPNVSVIADYDQLCKIKELDLIIITAPNKEHFSLAKKALLAGKNVVVDKPFVVSSAQGEELINISKKQNLLLSVFQNRRWDNGFLTLQNCIAEKKLQNISLYESYYDRFRPIVNKQKWKEQDQEGSGILYDLGSHLLDQAVFTLGMPKEIFANLQLQRTNASTLDYFHLILKYEKTTAILGASNLGFQPRPVFSILGDNGFFQKNGQDPQENALNLLAKGEKINFADWGVDNNIENKSKYIQFIEGRQLETDIPTLAGNYFQFYQQIYSAMVEQQVNPVDPNDAVNVIKLIELAYISNEQKKWIKVNFND
ncbi:Gfo/Idh/MocA family oxidoreductase [Pigmentibacter sp. JX0631]|uniref:Gfo/Idh/MocA family oxidoreductase n=1 Tax=Pigmentibacter sp. JX0631 TaxID=2976982 RepID=UPI002468EF8E|nr:Gfo/Idh/MocA family oxidoreductase [Pigmentibacter sp. JX0631]WGL59119.1 Gfo/Idh/MocA family oxidoreductase [Pigmentibacter sp. JX0631]